MAQSLLSGFIYLAIASIIITGVYLNVIQGISNCMNGTVFFDGVGACNGTLGYGTRGTTGWTTAEIALFSVLGLAGIIALLLGALQLGGVM